MELFKPLEFKKFKKQLKKLNLTQLKKIADFVDLKFTNSKNLSKEDIILCLDESDKNKLIAAFKQVSQKK